MACDPRDPVRAILNRGVLGLVLLALAVPNCARARTTIVPDDFPTIQAAVDALYDAWIPDTLLVRGGDYPERVAFGRGIRVEAIPSLDGSDNIPRIQGLGAGNEAGDLFTFIGLHITGNVQYGAAGPAKLHFIGCRFDAGMALGGGDMEEVRLTRCTLYQTVSFGTYFGVMDSCTVYGPVVMFTPYRATVVDNVFENAGSMYLRSREVVVARNRIRGGEHALIVDPGDELWDAQIVDNDIEGCTGYGIHVNGNVDEPVRLERNRIARCGDFGARLFGNITARANRVTDCRGPGLDLVQTAGTGLAEGNVVGRCGAGIQVWNAPWGDPANFTVRENTVHDCSGPGIAIGGLPGSTIDHNIVYTCGGLSAASSDPFEISCNDWFPLDGAAPSSSDLSVDPMFCDPSADDVRLRSDSPLLDAPGCGRIGAFGQGCEAPAVAMGFAMWPRVLEPASRARWVTASLEPPSGFPIAEIDVASVRLNDVPVAQGTEAVAGDQDRDGIPDLQMRFDRNAVERTLGIGDQVTVTISGRVGRRDFTGTDQIRVLRHAGGPRSEIPGHTPRERVLSIRAPSVDGVANGRRVEFSLVDESPAELEVLDVAGRVVHSRDVGERGPGDHELDLSDAGLAKGIYFLRLRQGTREARTRMVMVR